MLKNKIRVFMKAFIVSVFTLIIYTDIKVEAGEYDDLPAITLGTSTNISKSTISCIDAGIDVQGDVVIPETVTYDGITYKITEIGERAFYENTDIISVEIPDTLEVIGDSAFRFCSKLSSVTINEGLTTLGVYAFDSTAITEVEIPGNIKSIGVAAFRLCTNLESVIFNEGLESIGDNAFYNCSSLRTVEFPSTVKEICKYAFYGCTSMESISLNEGLVNIEAWAFYKNYYVEEIVIPSTVEIIGNRVFEHVKSIHKITYLGDVVSMGKNVFYDETERAVLLIAEDTNTVALNYDYDADNIKLIKIEAEVRNLRNPDRTDFYKGDAGYLLVSAYYYPDEVKIVFPDDVDNYSTEITYTVEEFMQESKVYFAVPLRVSENTHQIVIESYRDGVMIDYITVDLVVYGTVTSVFKTILQ